MLCGIMLVQISAPSDQYSSNVVKETTSGWVWGCGTVKAPTLCSRPAQTAVFEHSCTVRRFLLKEHKVNSYFDKVVYSRYNALGYLIIEGNENNTYLSLCLLLRN